MNIRRWWDRYSVEVFCTIAAMVCLFVANVLVI
jgi:hypothetical protein